MHAAGKVVKDLPFSFSSEYRLVSKQDFQSVFAKSRKITRNPWVVLYRPNLLAHPRIGIMLAKHHVKRAVDRNRLRRVIRESFRHHKDVLKGLDIIILLRSEWSPLAKDTLRDDIDNLWQSLLANLSKSV